MELSAPSELRYSFHGLGIRLTGESHLLEPLDGRLKLLRTIDADFRNGLTFEVSTGSLSRPVGSLRAVYDPVEGEVVYDDLTDELYLAFDDRLRALCKPVEGWTRIVTSDANPRNQWRLSHPMLTLPLIEMLKRRGMYSTHAAGVSRGGRGLLLAGSSGAGKTTLAVALARAGFDFMGDDMLFLSTDTSRLRIHAFPDEVDVTEHTASFFPELQPLLARPKRPGWPKWAFRAESVFDTQVAWTCTPAALVFPRIAASHTSHLEPIGAGEALMDIAPNVLLTEPGACQEHLAILARLANETPCYRLFTGRDFDALPDLLGQLVT